MAGTLTVSTLSDGTNSGSATDAIKGSARAWVNINGTNTPNIRVGYNVSSVTDNGTGNFDINFTNAMSDDEYSAVASAGPWAANVEINAQSTTAVQVVTKDVASGASARDPDYLNAAIFR
jgi:hypothetical protein